MMILFKRISKILAAQLIVLTFCNVEAQTVGREVAYLQTDRTTYIAGEPLFYKLYVLDEATKQPSTISKVGYVILRTINLNTAEKIRVKIDAGMARGCIILPDTLTSGVYQLVAFTSEMKNYGDQNFFKQEIVIANRFDKELDFKLIKPDYDGKNDSLIAKEGLSIKTDKQVYGMREKVRVSLSKMNVKANVSVSVYENPGMLPTAKSIKEMLREIQGASIGKQSPTVYLPESSGKILSGMVIDSVTQKGIPNANVLLSCIDTVPNLQYVTSDSTGKFQMLLSNYYNGKELFFTIKDVPENEHWKIKLEDELGISEKWNPLLVSCSDNFKAFISKSQNTVYINKSFHMNTDLIDGLTLETKFTSPIVYTCPVNTLLPSNFVALVDFPEIVVELFPLIRVFKQKDKYRIRVVGLSPYMFNDLNPGIFLDGVYVDDVNKIIGLGSDRIKKIDAIYDERIFGDIVFQGIIAITSKSNEIVDTTPAGYSLRIKNDNFNTGKRFTGINPDLIPDKNTPIFKQLLYWNPDLELKGAESTDFEFYTSDNTTNFIIKVEGISQDGNPVSSSTSIQVKNQQTAPEK